MFAAKGSRCPVRAGKGALHGRLDRSLVSRRPCVVDVPCSQLPPGTAARAGACRVMDARGRTPRPQCSTSPRVGLDRRGILGGDRRLFRSPFFLTRRHRREGASMVIWLPVTLMAWCLTSVVVAFPVARTLRAAGLGTSLPPEPAVRPEVVDVAVEDALLRHGLPGVGEREVRADQETGDEQTARARRLRLPPCAADVCRRLQRWPAGPIGSVPVLAALEARAAATAAEVAARVAVET